MIGLQEKIIGMTAVCMLCMGIGFLLAGFFAFLRRRRLKGDSRRMFVAHLRLLFIAGVFVVFVSSALLLTIDRQILSVILPPGLALLVISVLLNALFEAVFKKQARQLDDMIMHFLRRGA
jgi:hypothetical protein